MSEEEYMEIRLKGAYAVDDPHNPPIKTLPFGDANIFILGDIGLEDINNLASIQVQQKESGLYEAHVEFSVWVNSGYADRLDRQMLMGGEEIPPEPEETSLYIFSPFEKILIGLPDTRLEEYAREDGYFWDVARYLGRGKFLDIYGITEKNVHELKVRYNGLRKLREPKRFGFGINHKVDTQIGNLDYNVSVRVVS